jgi:hypothetical protein
VQNLNNSCANADATNGWIAPKTIDFTTPGSTAVTFSSSAGDNVTGNYDDFGGAFGLFEGSGTGDARNCVINRNAGQNPNKVADALGKYAIGWISLENAPAAGWKLVKYDGVSPNAYQSVTTATVGGVIVTTPVWIADANQRVNVAKGLYEPMFEFELLYPTASAYKNLFAGLKAAFSDPAVLNTKGIVVSPSATALYSTYGETATTPTYQVAKGTRGGNSCAPQLLTE